MKFVSLLCFIVSTPSAVIGSYSCHDIPLGERPYYPAFSSSKTPQGFLSSSKNPQREESNEPAKKIHSSNSLRLLDHIRDALPSYRFPPSLTSLDFSNSDIVDEDIEIISQLTQLKELNFATRPLTNEGMKTMSSLTNLMKLNLSTTYVNSDGLDFLLNMPSLQELDLSYLVLSNKFVETLKVRGFKHINLEGSLLVD